jgi:hypothetical protein
MFVAAAIVHSEVMTSKDTKEEQKVHDPWWESGGR